MAPSWWYRPASSSADKDRRSDCEIAAALFPDAGIPIVESDAHPTACCGLEAGVEDEAMVLARIACVDDRIRSLTLSGWTAPSSAPHLDPSISRLSGLRSLVLAGNTFRASPIPPSLGHLQNLEVLDLTGSGFAGAIPTEIANLPKLRTLRLGKNALTGGVPAELGAIERLVTLDLSHNRLKGPLTVQRGAWKRLRTLDVSSNNLSSTLPSALGGLGSLETLDVSANKLEGAIPAELGNLARLRSLTLAENRFSGTLPAEMTKLQLHWLDISGNFFSGTFPVGLTVPGSSYIHDNCFTPIDIESLGSWMSLTNIAMRPTSQCPAAGSTLPPVQRTNRLLPDTKLAKLPQNKLIPAPQPVRPRPLANNPSRNDDIDPAPVAAADLDPIQILPIPPLAADAPEDINIGVHNALAADQPPPHILLDEVAPPSLDVRPTPLVPDDAGATAVGAAWGVLGLVMVVSGLGLAAVCWARRRAARSGRRKVGKKADKDRLLL
ncbi:hypothetical protein HDU96_001356 [Phlyctochytrium bullatum]|nr:hypothetical protein HDU96_001356 [Phlyctochytrium bullatum]